jgi:predicted ATPase
MTFIDEALQRCRDREEGWHLADLLRTRGELALLHGAGGAAAAEADFLRALDLARRQETPSWELRAATSLARLRREQGRAGEARELVAPIYGRFTEGFGTADLIAAKALLDGLAVDQE